MMLQFLKMNVQIIHTLLFYLSMTSFTLAGVEIIKPYHPYYVKVGGILSVRCTSPEKRKLSWWRSTAITNWHWEEIVPSEENKFLITYISKEPSGYTEAVLEKTSVQLYDQGQYKCQDKEMNSFTIWAMTIEILTKSVTAQEGYPVQLFCNLTGFDTNVAKIEFSWGRFEEKVENDNVKYSIQNNEAGSTSLTIYEPVKSDGGVYKCAVIFDTTTGPLILKESVHVNTDALPSGSATLASSTGLLIQCVITAFLLRRLPLINR